MPPQVGVSSNIGRVTFPQGKPSIIYGRNPRMPVTAGVPQPTALAVSLSQSAAPVCPITRSEVPPSQPGIKVPVVPKAADLPSAIQAINKIIDIIATDSEPTIRWLEKYRVTTIVRIENPYDENQWVEVERIQALMMEDQVTGDLWYWELGTPDSPAPSTGGRLAQPFYGITGGVVAPSAGASGGGTMPQPMSTRSRF
jgi:hypothetical protein